MLHKTILNRVLASFQDFKRNDPHYFRPRAGERSLTSRLSLHMKPRFSAWDVDAEWDTMGEDKKTMAVRGKRVRVTPDILVHIAGIKRNLLVVEAKKLENRARARDHDKLRRFTRPRGPFNYKCGLYLVIDATNARIASGTVYVGGSANRQLTKWFRDRLKTQR